MALDERDEYVRQRLRKLELLRSAGLDPYPPRVLRTHTSAQVREQYRGDGDQLEVSVAGRLSAMRAMGKMAFVDLRDGSGRLQLQMRLDELGQEQYGLLELLDLGDFIGVHGTVFRTQRGELTVRVASFEILAKALRPPPEKWHGLADIEKRYRQRYLDLMSNAETVEVFKTRSAIIHHLRRRLVEKDFLEVETPVLQPVPGGGAARPFETYYNALDHQLYLRIALELYLKRCTIGGLERVFEIGRNFRNEGLSKKHNPEFTMMELYQAYADYDDILRLTEELVEGVAIDVQGTTRLRWGADEVEFARPWRRVTLRDAILEFAQVDIDRHPEAADLEAAARSAGLNSDQSWGRAKLVDELLSQFVEPRLVQPTFLVDYPVELSPLAKRKPGRPDLVERFEAFAGGMEIANAFTELNDPIDQRSRFEEQRAARAGGDTEAQWFDADFLEALEYGMPPTGGLGVGVDRVVMLLTDQHAIRDVILFPQLRQQREP